MPRTPHDPTETRRRLEGYLESYPALRGRVCRILLLHLHKQGRVRIDDVYRRARRAEGWDRPVDPNRPSAGLWAADETEEIHRITLELAAEWMTPREVDDVVWAAHRRDEAQSLEVLARMPDVPLALIADKVRHYATLPEGAADDADAWATPEGTRVALIRRLVSDRVEYIAVAKRHLRVRDVNWILERAIGTDSGNGRVGGKAAGMILAWAILRAQQAEPPRLPDTVFVLTDVYNRFKEVNGLTHLEDQKYRPIERVRDDYPAIREVFRNAEFPAIVRDKLARELERRGETPLVVRSSSVLEDSFGATFSGIYRSLFLPNQGPLESRVQQLTAAVAEIYASVFSPDAIQYRRVHHLLDHDERMAVMIQGVVGRRRGRYHFPDFAGVAFSRNDLRWSPRIRREDGLARIVLGLGTHAVDRVGDYARMVPLKAPTLRPEGNADEICRASQRQVDVVDLEEGGFSTIPVADALRQMGPAVADFVSVIEEDGSLTTPVADHVAAPPERLCVTFDRLLGRSDFPARVGGLLAELERAYGCPVDVEFAVDEGDLRILQCRPLGTGKQAATPRVPDDVPPEDRVFTARRYVSSGEVAGIRYLVVIDPRDYATVPTTAKRLDVARAVGRVNDALAGETFLLLGPGRWGSQDMKLGVPVGYADICHARALIEIARAAGGYMPEPSFGTHFFQDLIEAGILYLPLYPDDPGILYREDFLRAGPNALSRVSPRDASLSDVVRVLDVEEVRPGRRLRLVMDGERQEALCYLA